MKKKERQHALYKFRLGNCTYAEQQCRAALRRWALREGDAPAEEQVDYVLDLMTAMTEHATQYSLLLEAK